MIVVFQTSTKAHTAAVDLCVCDSCSFTFFSKQGQTIRQLVSSKTLRRVSMCCLAPSTGKNFFCKLNFVLKPNFFIFRYY